jgi:phospholipase A1
MRSRLHARLLAIALCAIEPAGAASLESTTLPQSCRNISDDVVRLACYDARFGLKERRAPESNDAVRVVRETRQALARNWLALTPYKTNYVLPYTLNFDSNFDPYEPLADQDEFSDAEVKFQISIRALLWPNMFGSDASLNVAYTQQSYWQVYANDELSSPFRQTDHEPELLLDFPLEHDVLGLRLRALTFGLVHHSNGQTDTLSRSWNRLTAQATFERGNFLMTLRPWYRIPEHDEDDDNPGIEEYMGQMEATFAYRFGTQTIAAVVKNNLRSNNKGGIQLDYSFPLFGHFKGYLQAYSGYGENLIDGDNYVNRIGVGFMLTDWF